MPEDDFIGEWRQLSPDPSPASIFVAFASDGRLTYTIAMDTIQHIALTWRLEGELLVTDHQRSRFRFPSPSRLVLERDGETFSYERTEATA